MKIDETQLNRPQTDNTEVLEMKVGDFLDMFGMTPYKAATTLIRTKVREEEIRFIASMGVKGADAGDQKPDNSHRLYPWGEDIVETAKATGTMRIYFISAEGQMVWAGNLNDTEGKNWGDSTVIAFPDGKVMLIDVGMVGFGKYLVENLRLMGVKKIDCLVLSHPHDDHCYSLKDEVNVLNSFEVRQMYFGGAWNVGWSEREMVENKAREYGVPLSILSYGDSFDFGGAHIDVLAPEKSVIGTVAGGNDGVNNLSIVMRIKFGERAALFPGDINYLVEERMLNDCPELLRADVLKIQHHGAANANSREFLEAVQPKVAYAMAWKFIRPEVHHRYEAVGCMAYTDLLDGWMRVVTDGNSLEWETSRKRLECADRYYEVARS